MLRCAPMHSPSALFSFVVTTVDYTLHVALFIFALRRKLNRNLVFFFVYIMLLVPRDFIWLWVSHTSLYGTKPAFYSYWVSEAILSVLRLATIIEICWRSLRNYPLVWALAWRALTGIGVVLFLWGANSTAHNTSKLRYLVTTGMQRFEFLEAVLLLTVLTIGVYYRIHITPLYRWVLTGICIYSAVQVANYELGRITVHPSNSIFDLVRRYSFLIAEAIWTWAVWRWPAVPAQPHELIPQAVYDEHSAEIHDRLRELNDRLTRLLRKNPR
jgi:hypothetical protein